MACGMICCHGVSKAYGPLRRSKRRRPVRRPGRVRLAPRAAGCGKTTLLRLIAGFEPPERADRHRGRPVAGEAPASHPSAAGSDGLPGLRALSASDGGREHRSGCRADSGHAGSPRCSTSSGSAATLRGIPMSCPAASNNESRSRGRSHPSPRSCCRRALDNIDPLLRSEMRDELASILRGRVRPWCW